MSFISKIWAHIKPNVEPFIDDGEKEVAAFLEAAIESLFKNGGKLLLGAAATAVATAETTGGTNQQKKNAAIDSVVATLTAGGIPVVMNSINLAIEAAVATKHEAAATTGGANA